MVVTALKHQRDTRWRGEGQCMIESGFSCQAPASLRHVLMDRSYSCMLHRQLVTFLLASRSNKAVFRQPAALIPTKRSQLLS